MNYIMIGGPRDGHYFKITTGEFPPGKIQVPGFKKISVSQNFVVEEPEAVESHVYRLRSWMAPGRSRNEEVSFYLHEAMTDYDAFHHLFNTLHRGRSRD